MTLSLLSLHIKNTPPWHQYKLFKTLQKLMFVKGTGVKHEVHLGAVPYLSDV